MLNSRPITLRVAENKDFVILIRILCLLVLFSAVLSPQPVAITLFAVLLLGAGWIARTLCYSNVCVMEVTLTIFPDGRVLLISADETVVQGSVEGRSWCTQWLSVLRIATPSKSKNLLVLSGQQAEDEYRRLLVWLRQNIFAIRNEGRVQL